jgi:lysophospholipase L1-like esterase
VRQRIHLTLLAVGLLTGCGHTPTTPTQVPTTTVNVVVFYDENGNGVLDANEVVRIPKAAVKIGTAVSTTDAKGRAPLLVAQGSQTITVDAGTLPPYYQVAAQTVTLPVTVDVNIPATLAIGANKPNYYMAYGDSLTSDLNYPETLVGELRGYFGAGFVNNEGVPGTRTDEGAAQINQTEATLRPANTLILYGTNDWNKCKPVVVPCFTLDNLEYMVNGAKGSGSEVFLATLPPVNVGYPNNQAPPDRQEWVHEIDVLIRQLAAKEGVVLVDLEKAFLADPDQASLFNDHIHPSGKGVGIMVNTFFDAITQRQAAGTSRSPFGIGFSF